MDPGLLLAWAGLERDSGDIPPSLAATAQKETGSDFRGVLTRRHLSLAVSPASLTFPGPTPCLTRDQNPRMQRPRRGGEPYVRP